MNDSTHDTHDSQGPQDTQDTRKSFTERIEVAGDQLVSTVNQLVKDGNARRVIVRDQHGKELMSIPLNLGVVGGGLVTLAAPGLAAVGALAALVAKVQLDIERVPDAGDVPAASPTDTDTSTDEAAVNEPGAHDDGAEHDTPPTAD
ncbi:DUF4342 domain-containing protein [Arsenicicoccus piscis]|nr:DUF4342 domain-containing protein [Arsenicicoccus piscis]MCH8626842.1 DUF4342 domain-containing protein [Arsenicicoccus piscis]